MHAPQAKTPTLQPCVDGVALSFETGSPLYSTRYIVLIYMDMFPCCGLLACLYHVVPVIHIGRCISFLKFHFRLPLKIISISKNLQCPVLPIDIPLYHPHINPHPTSHPQNTLSPYHHPPHNTAGNLRRTLPETSAKVGGRMLFLC